MHNSIELMAFGEVIPRHGIKPVPPGFPMEKLNEVASGGLCLYRAGRNYYHRHPIPTQPCDNNPKGII